MAKIYGAETSPYSYKVLSYYRYKQLPHEWISRAKAPEAYNKIAKLPIIPAVAFPDGSSMQDSTPIIERVEKQNPERSVYPPGVTLRFLSCLLEEFGDEWCNKWMFHFRWAREVDQKAAALRLAEEMAPPKARASFAKVVQKRMVTRGFAVGSNPKTAPLIEADFVSGIRCLNRHLATRHYLFGGRPSFGDFGVGLQLTQALADPTCGGLMREHAPNVVAFCERMLQPTATGDWESWDSLRPTLLPFLKDHVSTFLSWSVANEGALQRKEPEMTVQLPIGSWWQTVGGPQKYHAKSLKEIRRKYGEVAADAALRQVLSDAGCLSQLTASGAKM